MLTLEQVMNESLWVAKMNYGRHCGTYNEMKYYAESEDCRDFDLCAEQPEHLKPFYNDYFNHDGFITVQDFYNNIWLPKQNTNKAENAKKTWTEEEIKNLIQTNDKVLYGALRKLYACQTADEIETRETNHRNNMGFNGVDAPILSSICDFLNRTGFLTIKQKVIVRKKLVKYNRQLTRLANA